MLLQPVPTVMTLSVGLKPICTCRGSQPSGKASSFSPWHVLLYCIVLPSVSQAFTLFRRSPAVLDMIVKARPTTALDLLYGPIAFVPQLNLSLLRIGPLITTIFAIELVELPKGACVARAKITGKCSGDAPAITALMATFSTVSGRAPPVILIVLITSSGLWLVPFSIAVTRRSVGRMIELKSVHSLSSKSWRRFSSESGGSNLGSAASSDGAPDIFSSAVRGLVSAFTTAVISGWPVSMSLPVTYPTSTMRG